jgi:hypothetical protein
MTKNTASGVGNKEKGVIILTPGCHPYELGPEPGKYNLKLEK